jgi:hypothetical protein
MLLALQGTSETEQILTPSYTATGDKIKNNFKDCYKSDLLPLPESIVRSPPILYSAAQGTTEPW